MDVEIGKRTSSKLEVPNITDDNICMLSDVTGLGDTKEELISGKSQNSPVQSGKQTQEKLSPSSSATQLPLLQSTTSQMKKGGGLGDGDNISTNDDEGIATSQNIPVYPG